MAFFRLNVPFKDKEQAKQLGAKWYSADKYWYYKGDSLPEGLKRWYESGSLLEMDDGTSRSYDPETGEIIEKKENKTEEDRYKNFKSVSQVNAMISQIINATNEFRGICVKGEVTNYDGNRGNHYYFAIKDEGALLPCVMWDSVARTVLTFKLEKGQQVAIVGNLEYYPVTGKVQLIVSRIENIGAGQANLALLRLEAKLKAEGLFDVVYKKIIPKHPKAVGIITSRFGQAIKDICKVANKRNPYVQLILFHVNVQGVNAVPTIIKGIKELDGMGLDTIIVGRGGGTDEELQVYNDESIVRAVFAAVTPIISAVGHQGHLTLIDSVADLRVATPSEAAEEAIPDLMKDVEKLNIIFKGINDSIRSRINERILKVNALKAKLEQNSPTHKYKEQSEKLSNLIRIMRMNIQSAYDYRKDRPKILLDSIHHSMIRAYEARKDKPKFLADSLRTNILKAYESRVHSFEVLVAELEGLSPLAKLINGFGYITRDDEPVTYIAKVSPGDTVNIRIHDGEIEALVKNIKTGKE